MSIRQIFNQTHNNDRLFSAQIQPKRITNIFRRSLHVNFLHSVCILLQPTIYDDIEQNFSTAYTSRSWAEALFNKKHLKNVGPIRHCEPPHTACFTLPFTRCRYCRTPPAHRCPQQHQRQQRQRVTEGTAIAPWNGPKNCVSCWLHC